MLLLVGFVHAIGSFLFDKDFLTARSITRVMYAYLNTLSAAEIPDSLWACLHARDGFSRLRWAKLREYAPASAAVIETIYSDESERAACLRWVMRGLRLDLAVVKTDYDVRRQEAMRRAKHAEKVEAAMQKEVIG